ncbi:hypothetical protein Syn7502_00964 [Synechococcus sp. PCC 7502]|uniref:hypothetical protein n=1 Tax=Synechococcus sp. PCC 7502 TaxID=1173263 RepID=UPI00029F89F6|nr:hypothetical protein [Synechococcus sp. PCC 7502]AFY73079.1 hypothetical protein Syn7502_00964 [Synechococcus sp. PCC 7502]
MPLSLSKIGDRFETKPNVEVTITKRQKEQLTRLHRKGTSSDLQYVKALEVLKSIANY